MERAQARHHGVQVQMAIEAGSMFLDFAIGHQSADAQPMHVQVGGSETASILRMNHQRFQFTPMTSTGCSTGALDTSKRLGWSRAPCRAMLTLAHRLGKDGALRNADGVNPKQVEDPMLAAVAQACSSTPEDTAMGQTLGRYNALNGHPWIERSAKMAASS